VHAWLHDANSLHQRCTLKQKLVAANTALPAIGGCHCQGTQLEIETVRDLEGCQLAVSDTWLISGCSMYCTCDAAFRMMLPLLAID
jgi:hypothetical protein